MNGEAASKNAKKKRALSLKCTDTLNIALAREYHQKLDAALTEGRAVNIEAAEVERIDGAMLQLFCAFRRAAQQQGLSVHWKGVSDALRDSARLMGLDTALGLEQAP